MSLENIKNNEGLSVELKNYKRLGIDVNLLSYENGVLTAEVKQSVLINPVILTKSELIERGKKIFNTTLKDFEGFSRVLVKPKMWEFNNVDEVVTVDWILSQMKKYEITRADLVNHTHITKGNIALYFNGSRIMSKQIKIRLFYYFMALELGREIINS